jgi:predicted ATPase
MPCVVITGGPGAGKTSLLAELASRGHATVSESARAIIAERMRGGLSPRPDPLEFAREIERRDIEKYEQHRHRPDWVFFDRGVIEAAGMVHGARAMSSAELKAIGDRYPFHPAVFVLPPWQAIYVTDSERDQTYADAVRVHAEIVDWYKTFGYRIIAVPPASVEHRASQVIDTCKHA